MSQSEFADSRKEFNQIATRLRDIQLQFKQERELKPKELTLADQKSTLANLEKSFQYLEATFETLIPGEKRESRQKMEACRKDFNEIRAQYLQDQNAVNVQRNKEALASAQQNTVDYRANQDMRQKLLGTDEQLYHQDDQLNNIKQMGLETIAVNNDTNMELRVQREVVNAIADKN